MGLLDKAKKREKKVRSKKPRRKSHAGTSKRTKISRRKQGTPRRGLLHRAKHRKKELEYKGSTRFKRELESSKVDVTKTKEEQLKERAEDLTRIGPMYSTTIDKLYHHIKSVESMSLKKMMDMFNLNREQTEYWANVLNEEKLLELYYPPVGDAVLRVPQKEKSKTKNKSKKKLGEKSKRQVSKHKSEKQGKNKKIAAVSVVFAIIVVVASIYVLSPELLSPVIGILKYAWGKINLLLGGIL